MCSGWGHSLPLGQLCCSKGGPAPQTFVEPQLLVLPFTAWKNPLPNTRFTFSCVPCSTADLGHFYHQGTVFPWFYLTTSSQGQEDSQTFPDKGVLTLVASAMCSAHRCFHSPTLYILSAGLRFIRYEKNFCTCLSKRELKMILLHIFLQCCVVCISQVRIG